MGNLQDTDMTNKKPEYLKQVLLSVIRFVLFILFALFMWRFAQLHIPYQWHLPVGYLICSGYNAIFDFIKLIDNINEL